MKKQIAIATLCTSALCSGAVTTNLNGFVKASYMMTDKVVSGSEHKPFYANRSEGATDLQEEGKSQFSVTQSRWAISADNGSKTSAKFEFDLDAAQGSGAGSLSQARVRQANLVFKATENGTLTFGKKWSKFMGVLPYTYGYTRVSFFAGNSGFLVDGIDYTHNFGNTSVAVELSNSGDADVNLVSTPTTTLVVDHKMGNHKIGLAHTMANLKYKTVNDTHKDSAASGTKVYWAGKYNNLHVNLEYTMGSNLGSIQTGALAKASDSTDDEFKETAYLLSLKYAAADWSVFGGYGVDAFNDEEEAGDTNVSKNALMILGFDKVLDKGLKTFVEYNAFTTSHYSATDDESEDSNGSLIELGLMYKF